jgi:hypothetical protein
MCHHHGHNRCTLHPNLIDRHGGAWQQCGQALALEARGRRPTGRMGPSKLVSLYTHVPYRLGRAEKQPAANMKHPPPQTGAPTTEPRRLLLTAICFCSFAKPLKPAGPQSALDLLCVRHRTTMEDLSDDKVAGKWAEVTGLCIQCKLVSCKVSVCGCQLQSTADPVDFPHAQCLATARLAHAQSTRR